VYTINSRNNSILSFSIFSDGKSKLVGLFGDQNLKFQVFFKSAEKNEKHIEEISILIFGIILKKINMDDESGEWRVSASEQPVDRMPRASRYGLTMLVTGI